MFNNCKALQQYWERAIARESVVDSGIVLAPDDHPSPSAIRNRGRKGSVQPVGRRDCTRPIIKANR